MNNLKPDRSVVNSLYIMNELYNQKKLIERTSIQAMTAAFAITLHDKNGWGKKRLNKLMREVMYQFECIKDKHVTIEDFEKWAKEYGIEL